jgi:hypothetical protein
MKNTVISGDGGKKGSQETNKDEISFILYFNLKCLSFSKTQYY